MPVNNGDKILGDKILGDKNIAGNNDETGKIVNTGKQTDTVKTQT